VVQDVSERKALERAILEASNREQYRIGNDLHDGLGQELTGIALMLKGVAARMAKEHPAVLPDIDSIARLVSNAVESTRALARGLSPVNLERGGLIDALEGLAMHARDLYSTKVTFTHQVRSKVQIPAELGNHFYRIAQEAVTNAVRHGQAGEINIALSTVRGKVRMSITDDGCGIPLDAVDKPGMGLKIMQHRAQITGGTVRFENQSRGTRVVCESPIEGRRTRARTRKPVISA
jgi:signal transduction histidine kinase